MQKKDKKVALVTAGSKGLGFEICRQLGNKDFTVILTARHVAHGRDQTEVLKKENIEAYFHHADVNDSTSLGTLYEYVLSDFGRLDVLVNSANLLMETTASSGNDLFETLRHDQNVLSMTVDTNTIGAYLLCRAFGPIMRKQRYGRIVNVSSSLGQLSDMEDGYDAFRISKAGLNAVTRVFASKYKGHNILVNSVCPGWLQLDESSSSHNLQAGAESIVWAATLPDAGPTGGFFCNRKPIPW